MPSGNLVEIRIPKKFPVCSSSKSRFKPIKGILEILNLTPGAFRWIFWHGRIVSDQVQVRFHI
jgi:hypothetical protein